MSVTVRAPMNSHAKSTRTTAILHMAFDFASMGRTFEQGTKVRFIKRVRRLLRELALVRTQGEFEALHARFCNWGRRAIRSSHRGHQWASYGQIAKTLNVVLKVVVSYCELPNRRQAERLLPWLHPAIDNAMMKYLKRQYRDEFPRGVNGIADVDKRSYWVLLDLAARDAVDNLGGGLHPVQWEDIVWVKVNKKR